jgi:hypothetical protein
MLKMKKVMIEREECVAISCDCCKTEYENTHDNVFDIQEFVTVSFCGGYSSIFGDGNSYECHLCQQCVEKLLGNYLRRTTELC